MAKKKKPKQLPIEQFEAEYRLLLPVAEQLRFELTKQFSKLLDNEEISLGFPLESRVKSWDSILNKLERLPIDIAEMRELNDLVGLRLILVFRRDLESVCKLITDNFEVIDQYDTQERLKEDQFGYASIHFVVVLPESWLAVPTLAKLGGLRAELQVRTVAQHIWAVASHELQYKKESSVPAPIRRAIYRVSALLETVDLEFETVLKERELYRKEIATISTTDQALNVDLFEQTLHQVLPDDNREVGPSAYILAKLLHFGIDTQEKLNGLIERRLAGVLREDHVVTKAALVNRMLRLELGPERWKKYGWKEFLAGSR